MGVSHQNQCNINTFKLKAPLRIFICEGVYFIEGKKMSMMTTEQLYKALLKHMGPQGWWPADT